MLVWLYLVPLLTWFLNLLSNFSMTHTDISINGNSHSSHNVFFVFVLDGFFFFLQFTNRVKTTKLNLKLLHFKRDSHIYNDLKNQTKHITLIQSSNKCNATSLIWFVMIFLPIFPLQGFLSFWQKYQKKNKMVIELFYNRVPWINQYCTLAYFNFPGHLCQIIL